MKDKTSRERAEENMEECISKNYDDNDELIIYLLDWMLKEDLKLPNIPYNLQVEDIFMRATMEFPNIFEHEIEDTFMGATFELPLNLNKQPRLIFPVKKEEPISEWTIAAVCLGSVVAISVILKLIVLSS